MKYMLVMLIAIVVLVTGCATVSGPEQTQAPVQEQPVPEPPAPLLLEPPAAEAIVFLPQPRLVQFEPGTYVDDKLVPEKTVQPDAIPHAQGYILAITAEKILLTGHDAAGLFYAEQTLNQIKRQFADTGKLPVVRIEDWPDFPNRGVMLDVARDKVPTMETLFAHVDMFASLKFNQLQLYTEHTFAYPGHEVIW